MSADVAPTQMIKTYGLTHLALGVEDPERALLFYQTVLGVIAVYREPNFIQAQTPGSRDVLVFQRPNAAPARQAPSRTSAFVSSIRPTLTPPCARSSRQAARCSTMASSARASRTCSSAISTDTKSRSGTRSLPRSTLLSLGRSRRRAGHPLLLLHDLRRSGFRPNPTPELRRPRLRELGAEQHEVRRVVDPDENHRERTG